MSNFMLNIKRKNRKNSNENRLKLKICFVLFGFIHFYCSVHYIYLCLARVVMTRAIDCAIFLCFLLYFACCGIVSEGKLNLFMFYISRQKQFEICSPAEQRKLRPNRPNGLISRPVKFGIGESVFKNSASIGIMLFCVTFCKVMIWSIFAWNCTDTPHAEQ